MLSELKTYTVKNNSKRNIYRGGYTFIAGEEKEVRLSNTGLLEVRACEELRITKYDDASLQIENDITIKTQEEKIVDKKPSKKKKGGDE
jgi:hypothetical protein